MSPWIIRVSHLRAQAHHVSPVSEVGQSAIEEDLLASYDAQKKKKKYVPLWKSSKKGTINDRQIKMKDTTLTPDR